MTARRSVCIWVSGLATVSQSLLYCSGEAALVQESIYSVPLKCVHMRLCTCVHVYEYIPKSILITGYVNKVLCDKNFLK